MRTMRHSILFTEKYKLINKNKISGTNTALRKNTAVASREHKKDKDKVID
jgi:hypothetical protein